MNFETNSREETQPSFFLTEAEVVMATGCQRGAEQEKWFQERGLNVYRNRCNVVIVSREAYIRWQLGEKADKTKQEPRLRLEMDRK